MFKDIKNVRKIVIEDRDLILDELNKDLQKYENVFSNKDDLFLESSDTSSTKVKYNIRILDQLRKIEFCNNLRIEYEKQKKSSYDFVLRCRFDSLYISPPNWNLDKNCLHTEYTGSMGGYPHDGIVIATPEKMDNCFCNRYSHVEKLVRDGNHKWLCAHATFVQISRMTNTAINPDFIHLRICRSENRFHCNGTQYISDISGDIKNMIIGSCPHLKSS